MKKSKRFEFVVRAIIVNRGKVLLCKLKRARWWFFPGGHVELWESIEQALRRELKEETGVFVKDCWFIGIAENVFVHKGLLSHEINVVFKVDAYQGAPQGLEDHLRWDWVDVKKISSMTILPKVLQRGLLRWFKDGNVFWESNIK